MFLKTAIEESKRNYFSCLSDKLLDRKTKKAHGHDMISIQMLKICDESIWKPPEITVQSCSENEKFPSEWKIANVVPVFRKTISKN